MGPFRGLPLGLPSEFEVEIPNAHPGWIWLFMADVGSLRLVGGVLSTPDAGSRRIIASHLLGPPAINSPEPEVESRRDSICLWLREYARLPESPLNTT